MAASPLLLGTTDLEDRVLRMGIARLTVGGSIALTPELTARLFGVPPADVTPTARVLARLVGIRNCALGAWALAVRDSGDEERRLCFTVNACVDAVDLAVLLPNLLRRGRRRFALLSSALALSATLGWLDLLQEI